MNPCSDSPPKLFQQLDYRENDGIEVSMLWNRHNNRLTVFVCDTRDKGCFEVAAEPREARSVFEHPFAYAAACDAARPWESPEEQSQAGAAPFSFRR